MKFKINSRSEFENFMQHNLKKTISQILFTFCLFGCLVCPIKAALPATGSEITITSDPQYPSANQMVTLTAEIYITDINRVQISWFADGVLKQKGIGEKEFSFRTKALGKTTVIDVQMNSVNQGQINKKIKITPAEIDLIWETNTYTPPFYKGKALNTHTATMKIIAFPNFIDSYGNKIDAKNLVYKWENDWKVAGDKSGYGKNSFSFVGPQIFKDIVITVEAKSLDGTLKSKKHLSIKASRPEIIFYENNPLLGILDNSAIAEFYNQNQEELSVVARPLFFSREDLEGQTKYKWTMNGKTIGNNQTEIILKKSGQQTGSSLISLEIQNLQKIMQFTKNSFKIKI